MIIPRLMRNIECQKICIKIIDGNEKMFVAMPSRKTPTGEFKDIVHPITTEAREELHKAIIERYEEYLKEEPQTEE